MNCASDAKTSVIAELEESGATVEDFHTKEASLEDLFLAYTEGSAPGEGDPTSGDGNPSPDDAAPAEEVER